MKSEIPFLVIAPETAPYSDNTYSRIQRGGAGDIEAIVGYYHLVSYLIICLGNSLHQTDRSS